MCALGLVFTLLQNHMYVTECVLWSRKLVGILKFSQKSNNLEVSKDRALRNTGSTWKVYLQFRW